MHCLTNLRHVFFFCLCISFLYISVCRFRETTWYFCTVFPQIVAFHLQWPKITHWVCIQGHKHMSFGQGLSSAQRLSDWLHVSLIFKIPVLNTLNTWVDSYNTPHSPLQCEYWTQCFYDGVIFCSLRLDMVSVSTVQ